LLKNNNIRKGVVSGMKKFLPTISFLGFTEGMFLIILSRIIQEILFLFGGIILSFVSLFTFILSNKKLEEKKEEDF